jgi:VIT1/CCC1 family predicted Fe2+/Mn2+ transporter
MYISAFTIGFGYLLGGFIPLLPYFFITKASLALIYSCVVTGIVLLLFGAIKARITGAGNTIGAIIWGSLTTLLVGGIAAGRILHMKQITSTNFNSRRCIRYRSCPRDLT